MTRRSSATAIGWSRSRSADVAAAFETIDDLDRRRGVDAVVAVDDRGVVVAAEAGARLGFPHSPPDAVAATRDKPEMRRRLAAGEVPQPRFGTTRRGGRLPLRREADRAFRQPGRHPLQHPGGARRRPGPDRRILGRPDRSSRSTCPASRSRSRGCCATARSRCSRSSTSPTRSRARTSRRRSTSRRRACRRATLALVAAATERAANAIGLTEGPVHAEVRIHEAAACWVIEVAARSIGGLCARTLRFGAGISLEEVILRHAVGMPLDGLAREQSAAGVMMLPIGRARDAGRGARSRGRARGRRDRRARDHDPARAHARSPARR